MVYFLDETLRLAFFSEVSKSSFQDVGISPDAYDDERLQTRTLFEKCLGETVTVAGLETVDGLPCQLVQLDVGQMLGEAPYLEKIWVEPEYLQLEASS